MNFFIILEMGQSGEQGMDIELSKFGKTVKAGSGFGRGAVGTLTGVELTDPSYDLFTETIRTNPNKRDLLVKDVLLNEKNFINYWKSREAHRDSKILPYSIQYGTIDDEDGDKFPEKVAYYTDNANKNHIIGYNQYVLGPPNSSQKNVKANYYKLPSKARQQQSYADYMAANTDKLTGWMSAEAIQKYKESLEKKLITKVKRFFNEVPAYKTLTAAQKTKVANIFIEIVAEAMIDDDANRAKASVVKGMKGFIEAKKELIESLLKNDIVKINRPSIFNNIVAGYAARVEAFIAGLVETDKKTLNSDDINELFKYVTQNKFVRSLGSQPYSEEIHKAGYEAYLKNLYGGEITPMTDPSKLGELFEKKPQG